MQRCISGPWGNGCASGDGSIWTPADTQKIQQCKCTNTQTQTKIIHSNTQIQMQIFIYTITPKQKYKVFIWNESLFTWWFYEFVFEEQLKCWHKTFLPVCQLRCHIMSWEVGLHSTMQCSATLSSAQLNALQCQIMSWSGCLHWGKAAAAFGRQDKILKAELVRNTLIQIQSQASQ